MERPSSSVNPMQRHSAVVASDSIQTPWIVPSLHPARCDKQFPCASLPLSGSFSTEFPLFAVSGQFRPQLRLVSICRGGFYPKQRVTIATSALFSVGVDASGQYPRQKKARSHHAQRILPAVLQCPNQLRMAKDRALPDDEACLPLLSLGSLAAGVRPAVRALQVLLNVLPPALTALR